MGVGLAGRHGLHDRPRGVLVPVGARGRRAILQGLSATVFALCVRALLRAWHVNAALERWQDPLLPETGGDLYGALRRLPDRFRHDGPPAITVTIEGSAPLTLAEGAQDHIFRIAQEALTHAVKHAGAQRIDIVLRVTPTAVKLTVRDDGSGLPATAARSGGLGHASMRHRASAIGALLYVSNLSAGGTEVRLDCVQQPPEREQRARG